ncbi:hypothetical protein [Helicobacter didelphidarum]|nr:hypothetical protein [Helicobacter didelphidarum]
MYKQKFDDFYKLVCKYDENRLLMPLFYSEMVEDEIRKFFNTAKQIKERNTASYKPTAAMVHLMEICESVSEIETEESNFFYQLKKQLKIQRYQENSIENYEDMLEKHQEYNLESMYSLNNIKQMLSDINKNKDIDEEIAESIKALSYINMIRQSKPQNLFNSKAMLITNTNITNRIAWHEDIMEGKIIPLSSHLDFITARLWEFIETSLGKTEKLISFNPIFHLQIALKEILQENLSKQYIRAEENYKKDRDKDRFCREILDIQNKMKLEPNTENADFFEIILSSDEIEEQRKLQTIESEKKYQEGIEYGKFQGKKEAEEEFQYKLEEIERKNKRKQKKDNYPKRLKQYKKKKCKKNIKNIPKLLLVFIKKYKTAITVIASIISFISALITILIFLKGYFNAN